MKCKRFAGSYLPSLEVAYLTAWSLKSPAFQVNERKKIHNADIIVLSHTIKFL